MNWALNQTATIYRPQAGAPNQYGNAERTLSALKTAPCRIIENKVYRLAPNSAEYAWEYERIALLDDREVRQGDVLDVDGQQYEIVSLRRRNDVRGAFRAVAAELRGLA